MGQTLIAKRRHWKKQISEWEQSGMSGRKWATEKNHHYQTFLYWKNRYHDSLQKEDFIELSSSPIKICYRDVQIQIEETINQEALASILATVKEALC